MTPTVISLCPDPGLSVAIETSIYPKKSCKKFLRDTLDGNCKLAYRADTSQLCVRLANPCGMQQTKVLRHFASCAAYTNQCRWLQRFGIRVKQLNFIIRISISFRWDYICVAFVFVFLFLSLSIFVHFFILFFFKLLFILHHF